MKPRVVLVEDHEVFRLGLRHLLDQSGEFEVVGEAGGFEAAVELITAEQPDIVVLDIVLHDGDGLQLLAEIAGQQGAPRVLVLSGYSDSTWADRSLQLGAHGYVDKLAGFDEILCAIRSVAMGRTFVSVRQAGQTLRHDPPAATDADAEKRPGVDLSDREQEVLRRIARGMTNQQTADELYLSVKTVETYRSRLTRKLGLRSRSELFAAAERAGLLTG